MFKGYLKCCLFSCLLFYSFSLLNAQYLDFYGTGAAWKCDDSNYDIVGGCGGTETSIYAINGTIQSGQHTYHRLSKTSWGVCSVLFGQPYTCGGFGNSLQGLRTDTVSGIVYGLDVNFQESEIFDYHSNPGDTMVGLMASTGVVIVDSVDTVLIGGLARRRLRLNTFPHPFPDYVIEGIGPTNGFFGWLGFALNGEDSKLVCYSENGNPIFSQTSCSSGADCLSLNSEERRPGRKLEVHPSPTHGPLKVQLPESSEGTIALFDLVGRKVYESAVAANLQELKLDFSGLPKGQYILRFVGISGNVQSARVWLR
jgi:hypothetical protein